MNVSRGRLAAVLAVALTIGVTGGVAAADAPANACDNFYTSNSIASLKQYTDCRDDRIEKQLSQIQAAQASTSSPTPTPTPTPSPSPSKTPSPTPTPTPTPTPSPTAAGLCLPGKEVVKFVGQGSAGMDRWAPEPGYDASAELWGVNGYNYEQTMGVCSNDSWYVDVKTDNVQGDGAVKAYPSMRKIYWDYSTTDGNMPRLSTFPKMTVDFAGTGPATCPGCIYDTAFDIWLNGIGNGTANELMVWTKNVGQTPYGAKVASGITFAGHTWDLWSGASDHYLALVPTDTADITSGTLDVKALVALVASKTTLTADPKVGQLSYGVETVSTNAVFRHWDFTKFTVHDK